MAQNTSRRGNRTAPAAQTTPANTDAPADQDATPTAPAPAPETPAPVVDAPDTDAGAAPVTPDATPDTDTDADAPATPDATPAPAPAATFESLLQVATAATSSQPARIAAYAAAIQLARQEMITTLAARKDDEIIAVDTFGYRPNSASGRGPTMAKLQGLIAATFGGAAFVSVGNCHLSTAKYPIFGHVVIPRVLKARYDALHVALDAPYGPIRVAEADVKRAARDRRKVAVVTDTLYAQENKASRLRMLDDGNLIVQAVGFVADPDGVAVMRDVVTAVTAELQRSGSLVQGGPRYLISPTDAYAVKVPEPELQTVTA